VHAGTIIRQLKDCASLMWLWFDKKKRGALRRGKVVPPPRFERGTPGLGILCSILLSYGGTEKDCRKKWRLNMIFPDLSIMFAIFLSGKSRH
jgi:hypothetical protein